MLIMKTQWGEEQIIMELSSYAYGNKGTALQLYAWDDEFGFWEPYATATVNLDKKFYKSDDKDVVFIDDNNCPFLSEWLEENGLATFTGRIGSSGYCFYEEMKLNREAIEKHCGADAVHN